MQKGKAGESYNVVSGVSTSVNEIVATVLSEYGSKLQPERIEDARVARSTGHSQLLISNRKAREQLGWEPSVTVAVGVHRLRLWLDQSPSQ